MSLDPKPDIKPVDALTPREKRLLYNLQIATGMLTSRAQLASAGGKTYQGNRDMYVNLGYKPGLQLSDYKDRFKRDGIARRVVKSFADATWRGAGGELVEDEDPNIVTPFEAAWLELSDRLKIWSVFHRADILAGLGRYAVILLGAPGNLEAPLKKLDAKNLVFMTPYAEETAGITAYETNVQDPRYANPSEYELQIVTPATNVGRIDTPPTKTMKTHWTRIIHIAEGIENSYLADPKLECVWNYFDDLDKIRGGGSEAFWQHVLKTTVWNLDPQVRFAPGEEEKFSQEVEDLMNGLKRHLQTRGMEAQQLDVEPGNIDKNVGSLIDLIAGGSEIPQRILLGSERGQLASEQDRENWAERVQDRREQFAAPICVRQLVERLLSLGALPEPKQYEVAWPTRDQSDADKAALALSLAQTNQANTSVGPVFSGEEIRDISYGMEPLDPEFEQAVLDRQTMKDQAAVEQMRLKGEQAGQTEDNPRPKAVPKTKVAAEARRYELIVGAKRKAWLKQGRKATR